MTIERLESLADYQADLLPALSIDLPNPLIHLNIARDQQSVFRHRLMTANAARRAQQPAVALYRYPPGTLVDGDSLEPYATLAQGKLVRQQVPDWVTDLDGLAAGLAARGAGAPVVQAPCLLVARFGDVTWGHWLCEMLSKIVLAEAMEPKKFTYVVPTRVTLPGGPISDHYVRAVLQSLHAYGIEPHRLLRVPPHQPVRFDALFDMSGIFAVPEERFFGMHPDLLSLMQTRLQILAAAATPAMPYLVRAGRDMRQITNHDAVLTAARRHGYTPVNLADMDFATQVRLFQQAKSLAGALGSGLTGMIHAPPNLPLLTLAPADWQDMYFVNLFQKKQVRHADIRGVSTKSVKGDIGLSPFSVPVSDVYEALGDLAAASALQPDIGAVRLGAMLLPRRLGAEMFAVTFGTGGNSQSYKRAGWAEDEPGHCWSVGAACELLIPHSCTQDCWLTLEGFCFDPPGIPMKMLAVAVNGVILDAQWVAGSARPAWLVRQNLLAAENPVSLRFLHPISPSPRSLGVSNDDRPLGFAFVRLALNAIRPEL